MESTRKLIEEKFSRFHSQKSVILKVMEYGLRIEKGKILCNDIEIELRSIGEACGVDNRVVKAVIDNVESDPKLSKIFSNMRSTLHLGQVAPTIGLGEIVIEAFDAREPGIIYQVAQVLSKHKISIRQAIGDDPDFVKEPKLYVITDSPIPSKLIPEIKGSGKIKGVTIY